MCHGPSRKPSRKQSRTASARVEVLFDRVDAQVEFADADLDALESTVEAAAEVADLVDDRGLGGSDATTDLVAEVVDAPVLGFEIRGNTRSELADHRLEVVVGHGTLLWDQHMAGGVAPLTPPAGRCDLFPD